MHAIIRLGAGKYYISAVYGYLAATADTNHIGQSSCTSYWIIWNEKKNRLIRWTTMVPNTKELIPQILIVDSDQHNWNTDHQGFGCIDFLNRDMLVSFLDNEIQPDDVLSKCHSIDDGYIYEVTREIKTKKDIDDLMWVSGFFHDARIINEKLLKDGTLYLRFDGVWGCNIETWFWGDLEYDLSSRHLDDSDPYWLGSTVKLKDGFVCFIDEYDIAVEQIEQGFCYIKARHMKYRVIPD